MKNNIKKMVANLIINALCQMSLEDFLILDGAVDRIVLNAMQPARKGCCHHDNMDGYRKLLNDILAPETNGECDGHNAAMEELERREIELDEREYELDERERELNERSNELDCREHQIEEREAELDAIEDEEPQTDNIFRDIDYGKVRGLVTNILGMLGGRE